MEQLCDILLHIILCTLEALCAEMNSEFENLNFEKVITIVGYDFRVIDVMKIIMSKMLTYNYIVLLDNTTTTYNYIVLLDNTTTIMKINLWEKLHYYTRSR